MLTGICILPVIPMRKTESDLSEMTNQVLFGETFKIINKNNKWSYIKLDHDGYEGWIDNKQLFILTNITTDFHLSNKKYANIKINSTNQPLLLGSLIPQNRETRNELKISENLNFCHTSNFETWFIKIAKKYLNTPYLWGGRTPIGIDCSGYVQMVYRFFNQKLPRDSSQQARIGKKILNFKNTKLGDLAFFEQNKAITHVGIILKNHKIIHASGKVQIDILDEKGIYNTDAKIYTHKLKMIKRII